MKFIFLLVLTVIANDPVKVHKINKAKEEAKDAFQSGDYKTAIKIYNYLVDSLDVREDEVMLNLAHAYYLQKDTANAYDQYKTLTQSAKKNISSKANLQMGLLTNQRGKPEEALSYFKKAIKDDPANEEARYNYEMLKKKLDDQKKQQQQNKDQQNKDQKNKDQQNKEDQKKNEQNKKDENKENKDQQNKDQQNKDQQNKEQQKKEQEQKEKEQQDKSQKEKEQQEKQKQEQAQKDQQKKENQNQNLDREKLEQMKISEEKARMILEAMKNQEKQYLQQNKRKATKSKDRSKPDW